MGLVTDLQTYLGNQSIVDGATGWVSSRRKMHDGQDQVVVIGEDGGTVEIFKATGVGSGAIEDPAVLVTVRAGPSDSDASRDKAQEILDALHGQTGLTIGSVEYLRIASRTAEPIFLGFDDDLRPTHTVSLRFAAAMTA